MPPSRPHVFTIPASAPFLPTLINALRDGTLVLGFPAGGDPLALAKATLYLPTRRACRLARDVFLDHLNGDASILPRIVALGDLDEDEIIFAEASTGELADPALNLLPTFGALERRLTLAELVSTWATAITPEKGAPLIANTPEAAVALADALARLMDDMPGGSRPNIRRTLFAVGDEKQSIFSFQGAAPEAFDVMRRLFAQQFDTPDLGWKFLRFHHSFRSGAAVLGSVDQVFSGPEVYESVTTDAAGIPKHESLPEAAPGLVELWPLVEPAERKEIEGWDAPFDTESEKSPRVLLAQKIAKHAVFGEIFGALEAVR